jgi:hypothetical protein
MKTTLCFFCFFLLFIGCKDKNVSEIEQFFSRNNNLTLQEALTQFGDYSWCEELFDTHNMNNNLLFGWQKKTVDGKRLYIRISFSTENVPSEINNILKNNNYRFDYYRKNKYNEALDYFRFRKMISSSVDVL